MPTDPRYTKANVTPAAARVLKIIAAEQNKYIYEVVDDLIKEKYPGYFRKIGCWETQKSKHKRKENRRKQKSETFIFSKYVFRV